MTIRPLPHDPRLDHRSHLPVDCRRAPRTHHAASACGVVCLALISGFSAGAVEPTIAPVVGRANESDWRSDPAGLVTEAELVNPAQLAPRPQRIPPVHRQPINFGDSIQFVPAAPPTIGPSTPLGNFTEPAAPRALPESGVEALPDLPTHAARPVQVFSASRGRLVRLPPPHPLPLLSFASSAAASGGSEQPSSSPSNPPSPISAEAPTVLADRSAENAALRQLPEFVEFVPAVVPVPSQMLPLAPAPDTQITSVLAEPAPDKSGDPVVPASPLEPTELNEAVSSIPSVAPGPIPIQPQEPATPSPEALAAEQTTSDGEVANDEVGGLVQVAKPLRLPGQSEPAATTQAETMPNTGLVEPASPIESLPGAPTVAAEPNRLPARLASRSIDDYRQWESNYDLTMQDLFAPSDTAAAPLVQMVEPSPTLAVNLLQPGAPTTPSTGEITAEELPLANEDHVRPISAMRVNIRPSDGEMPKNAAAARFAKAGTVVQRMGASRAQNETHVQWEASSVSHGPLHFEEINLERHGYRVPVVQPVVSAAHFFGRVPALPYLMTVERRRDNIYTLGHYRPGTYSPFWYHRPRLRFVPGSMEALAAAGLIIAIP